MSTTARIKALNHPHDPQLYNGHDPSRQVYSEEFGIPDAGISTIFIPARDSMGSYGLSTDSTSIDLQTLRERSQLISPLVLERSHSHGTAALHAGNMLHNFTSLHNEEGNLYKPLVVKESPKKTSSLINAEDDLAPKTDTGPKTPHHISSIHPNVRSRLRLRNKSEDFALHDALSQDLWDSSNDITPHQKKHLGEYLKNLRIGADSTKPAEEDVHVSTKQAEGHVSIASEPATNNDDDGIFGEDSLIGSKNAESQKLNETQAGYDDLSGCLACDKCFPGGRLTIVPLMDSRDYTGIPPKERALAGSLSSRTAKTGNHSILFSWFRSKKKSDRPIHKPSGPSLDGSTYTPLQNFTQEAVSAPDDKYKDLEMAVNTMKEEVCQAKKNRDAALAEVSELKLAIQEMGKKLGQLEDHYEKLEGPSKRPIGNTQQADNQYGCGVNGKLEANGYMMNPPRISSSWGIMSTGAGPTKREFCHAVVEARVAVKKFCRTLVQQLHQQSALEKINTILEAQNLSGFDTSSSGMVSRRVKYLLESIINQAFYEDFENIKFKKSGSHCVLDPRQRPLAFYKTYLGISQVGWSDLVSKDSSVYSESFDAFCDEKMSKLVEKVLCWDLEGGWMDELVKTFFVAAKWVWLLHLLAFSFEHPATIFRVGVEAQYDPLYMEELPSVEHSGGIHENGGAKFLYGHHGNGGLSEHDESPMILAMVMPGFFFNSYEVIRCKVLLSSVH